MTFNARATWEKVPLCMDDYCLCIHPHASHQRTVSYRHSRDIEAATLYGKQEIVFAGKLRASDHVSNSEAVCDYGRFSINHELELFARVII